jgi:glycosyltransferase involved in cell wall biosynthesis
MTVAWFSFFPVEWLPDAPPHLRALPRQHPATWQRVLLTGLVDIPELELHIIVLRRHFAKDETLKLQGATFHLVKTPPKMRATTMYWLDTLRIRRLLRSIQPDVVHAWGTENGAALVAARLGLPAVVTVQGLASWMEELFPLSSYEHLAGLLERYSLRRISKNAIVTGESTFSSGYLRDHFPKLDVRHIDLVPDAIFHQMPRIPDPHAHRFVFVGELGPRKGGDTLILALNELLRKLAFRLVVIGSAGDHFLARMKASTSPVLWDRIEFKQGLTSPQVAQELARATMLLCPTRADTGPLAVKEAVVAGVPVVASRVGGVPDYVVPGENGLLFPVGDHSACAEAIASACAHPLFSQGLVNAERLARMRSELSPEKMAGSFLETYREACGRKC